MQLIVFLLNLTLFTQIPYPFKKSFNIIEERRIANQENIENIKIIDLPKVEEKKPSVSADKNKNKLIQQKYDEYLFKLHLKNQEKKENNYYYSKGISLFNTQNYNAAFKNFRLISSIFPKYNTVLRLIKSCKNQIIIEEKNNKRFGIWIKNFKVCESHTNHACVGSAFCNKCSNCSKCSHCNSHGGKCGICNKFKD